MDQLSKIESGDANAEDVSNIIGISDSMVKTYNVELRTRELELRTKEEMVEKARAIVKNVSDHNEADAIHILMYAINNEN